MTEGFAAIPNWMFRDKTKPSIFAVMVYGALASHQGRGGVYPSRMKIAEEAQCSVRKVADALNELEALGVLVRTRRTNKSGQATSGYDLRPGGVLGANEEEAQDASTGEVGAHGALGEGTSVHFVPLIEEEPLKKNPDEDFEAFWKVYPLKADKANARRAFNAALKRASSEVIIAGAKRYRDDPSRDPKFTKYPQGWLSGDRWADESSVVAAAAPELLVGLPSWLSTLKIPVEEYLERRSEPGWVESMAQLAERAAS